ncbi:MAG: hypothetical protein K2H09_09940 [Treponemataceae bacterium]|nr:hypothetical protein [Treponemataceae bacterium]
MTDTFSTDAATLHSVEDAPMETPFTRMSERDVSLSIGAACRTVSVYVPTAPFSASTVIVKTAPDVPTGVRDDGDTETVAPPLSARAETETCSVSAGTSQLMDVDIVPTCATIEPSTSSNTTEERLVFELKEAGRFTVKVYVFSVSSDAVTLIRNTAMPPLSI